uniref:Peptidase_M14 domain-containing protein n=1 Tax=Macrostomum lignano TaxID=282301 RepID=A0A1I8F9Y3_9PLAT
LGLTFFNYPSHRNVKVDILVPPRLVSAFRKAVAGRPDIQLELPAPELRPGGCSADRENRQFSAADEAAAKGCSEEIGSAYEGRKLIVLRIEKSQTDKQKRKVWIDGGIHAREWISPATVLYMADVGLNRRMWTPEVVALLDYYDFLMLPLYNPDGYEYSHSHYRFWRKKPPNERWPPVSKPGVQRRRPQQKLWLQVWGGSGSSSDPCQDNYRGAGPFSAMESAAVKRFVEQENSDKKILLFLSYHSYGQYVLMPFGFKRGAYRGLRSALARCREMFSTNHRFYIHGTSADVLYEGQRRLSDDWAHGSLEVPYSLTVELPDDGRLRLPAAACLHSQRWQRGGAGLLAMLRTIHDLETNTNFYRTRCLRPHRRIRLLAAPE